MNDQHVFQNNNYRGAKFFKLCSSFARKFSFWLSLGERFLGDNILLSFILASF